MEKRERQGPYGRITRRRSCLMCREGFESEGAHNRVCDRCKASRTWREGSLDYAAAEQKDRR